MASFTPLDAFVPSDALSSLASAGTRRLRASGPSLIIVFGDQLTPGNPAIAAARAGVDLIVIVDDAVPGAEAPGRRYRQRRAAEAFAESLLRRRHRVEIADAETSGGAAPLQAAMKRLAGRSDYAAFVTAEPGCLATRRDLEALVERYRKPLSILRDPRFICSRWDFAEIVAKGDGPLGFYAEMRRREALLMDGDAPEGGRWRHIDGDAAAAPERAPGDDARFGRPTPTAAEAEAELERFALVTLPRLGACEYLDPTRVHPFPCPEIEALLDLGLLGPRGVSVRIERAYREGHAPLHAAENAIYRLIGLREFRRGLARIGDLPATSHEVACRTAA